VPNVRTRAHSLFVYEEAPMGITRLSLGARIDGTQVGSEDDAAFGPGRSRRFTTGSTSAGLLVPFGDSGWAVAANGAYNERAPNYAELFANGPHIATGLFEVGNVDQKLERSTAFDVALRKRTGFVTGSVGAFAHRFSNFIGLFPTGNIEPSSGLAEAVFRGVQANLRGAEASLRFHLVEDVQHTLHFDLGGDLTRATDATTGQPLPRIAPMRLLAGVFWRADRTSVRLDVTQAAQQDRVTANELPSDGYTLINLGATYALPVSTFGRLELFVKGTNLANDEIRVHTSTLKDIAPLGRRAVMVGVTGTF
jgi:iron complex outermembrane recepter protein